jgi:hypothetical protein
MKLPQAFFLKKPFIAVLIVATTMALTLPPKGWALLAPTRMSGTVDSMNSGRREDLKVIQKMLESKILRQRLQDFGLTPEETQDRMSRLSDAQVHQLAMQARHLNPGGDAGLGILVTLLVLGILVLLFVYLLKRV